VLNKATTKPSEVLSLFTSKDIPIAFFCPTETALNKSIIDATYQVRETLKEFDIHDFENQLQGTANKKLIESFIVKKSSLVKTKTSLYRPDTKKGDPRFWPYEFASYASAWDLFGLIPHNGNIYYVNCSDPALLHSINNESSPLGKLAQYFAGDISEVASELLAKLKDISSQGSIPSLRDGTTGVGYTLETLLGIEANSKTLPDYKGIELKASRKNPIRPSRNRQTLFSKAPLKNSPLKPIDVINQYGYFSDEEQRMQLYCTLNATKLNSQGLSLKQIYEDNQLSATFEKDNSIKKLLLWNHKDLSKSLLKKHNETFWVKAESQVIKGKEYFHYYEAIHSKKPIVENFFYLIDDGLIEVDFLMHIKENKTGVRDHGYLFKIWPHDLDKLIPLSVTYQLC